MLVFVFLMFEVFFVWMGFEDDVLGILLFLIFLLVIFYVVYVMLIFVYREGYY